MGRTPRKPRNAAERLGTPRNASEQPRNTPERSGTPRNAPERPRNAPECPGTPRNASMSMRASRIRQDVRSVARAPMTKNKSTLILSDRHIYVCIYMYIYREMYVCMYIYMCIWFDKPSKETPSQKHANRANPPQPHHHNKLNIQTPSPRRLHEQTRRTERPIQYPKARTNGAP